MLFSFAHIQTTAEQRLIFYSAETPGFEQPDRSTEPRKPSDKKDEPEVAATDRVQARDVEQTPGRAAAQRRQRRETRERAETASEQVDKDKLATIERKLGVPSEADAMFESKIPELLHQKESLDGRQFLSNCLKGAHGYLGEIFTAGVNKLSPADQASLGGYLFLEFEGFMTGFEVMQLAKKGSSPDAIRMATGFMRQLGPRMIVWENARLALSLVANENEPERPSRLTQEDKAFIHRMIDRIRSLHTSNEMRVWGQFLGSMKDAVRTNPLAAKTESHHKTIEGYVLAADKTLQKTDVHLGLEQASKSSRSQAVLSFELDKTRFNGAADFDLMVIEKPGATTEQAIRQIKALAGTNRMQELPQSKPRRWRITAPTFDESRKALKILQGPRPPPSTKSNGQTK